MRIFRKLSSVYAHIRKEEMRIYRVSLPYMSIFSCICAFTEGKMHIYEREISSMHLFAFCKCAYTEGKMHIYRSSLLYMHILASVNVHIWKEKCAYTEESFRICAFSPFINAHIQKARCTFIEASYACEYFLLPIIHLNVFLPQL